MNLLVLTLIVINSNQCFSFNHDSNHFKYDSLSNLLISYQNYVNHQSNNLLSVFNINQLNQLIKVSNVSLSCGSSLRRLISTQDNQFEYWAITSELLINLLIDKLIFD